MTNEPSSGRRPYRAPQLQSLGTLADRTQGLFAIDEVVLPGSGIGSGCSPTCEG